MATEYTVTYEHDGDVWFASVKGMSGAHTQGRSVPEARERIREVIGLFDDDAANATIVDEVRSGTMAFPGAPKG